MLYVIIALVLIIVGLIVLFYHKSVQARLTQVESRVESIFTSAETAVQAEIAKISTQAKTDWNIILNDLRKIEVSAKAIYGQIALDYEGIKILIAQAEAAAKAQQSNSIK